LPKNSEGLRTRTIKKFVEDREFEEVKMLELVDRLSDYATVNKLGDVFLKKEDLTDGEKAMIVLSARFLGHYLEPESMNETASVEDVVRYGNMDKMIANARLAELSNEHLVDRVGKGMYRVRSAATLQKWLDGLGAKYYEK
jgi:hypothetical protein